jgi:hypothetical protein
MTSSILIRISLCQCINLDKGWINRLHLLILFSVNFRLSFTFYEPKLHYYSVSYNTFNLQYTTFTSCYYTVILFSLSSYMPGLCPFSPLWDLKWNFHIFFSIFCGLIFYNFWKSQASPAVFLTNDEALTTKSQQNTTALALEDTSTHKSKCKGKGVPNAY